MAKNKKLKIVLVISTVVLLLVFSIMYSFRNYIFLSLGSAHTGWFLPIVGTIENSPSDLWGIVFVDELVCSYEVNRYNWDPSTLKLKLEKMSTASDYRILSARDKDKKFTSSSTDNAGYNSPSCENPQLVLIMED